jgi:hypothetical protein
MLKITNDDISMIQEQIQQKVAAFSSRCRVNKSRLSVEKNVQSVVRCSKVSCSQDIRPLVRHDADSLNQAASDRIEFLIKETKAKIDSCTNDHVKLKLLGLSRQDWSCLRGNFPRLAQQAETYLQQQFQKISKDAEDHNYRLGS